MIRDEARKILAAATPLTTTILGTLLPPTTKPCLLAGVGSADQRGWPVVHLTAKMGEGGEGG